VACASSRAASAKVPLFTPAMRTWGVKVGRDVETCGGVLECGWARRKGGDGTFLGGSFREGRGRGGGSASGKAPWLTPAMRTWGVKVGRAVERGGEGSFDGTLSLRSCGDARLGRCARRCVGHVEWCGWAWRGVVRE
jgi:hypothetical protein